MRAFLLLLAVASSGLAEGPVLFGVRGGTELTNNGNIAGTLLSGFGGPSSSHRYEIGPTVGLRLPLGFSVEGDALFTRQALGFGQFAGFSAVNTHVDTWEFPVMLKFAAGRQAIAPVIGAGVSVRHLNDFRMVPSFVFTGSTSQNTVGVVAGGGVRFRVGPVAVTPELRYTRWTGNSFAQSFLDFLPLSQNQASLLVGVTF
jgi:hypothetical protein